MNTELNSQPDTTATTEPARTPSRLRRLAHTLWLLCATVLIWCGQATTVLAQGGGGGSGGVEGRVDQLQGKLLDLARPAGVFSLTFILFACILSPVAREWAERNKAAAMTVILGLVGITFAQDIVAFILP
ncbi:MAG TPA: hypothetical protein VFS21_24130 [Roseiflexaceae bacterium]|nr:hypothetical protein [Roseiflexaceae bacterium]